MADWTQVAAKKLAVICRKHGLRSRVVVCKHREPYTAIYHEPGDSDFALKHKAALQEARQAGWDGFERTSSGGRRLRRVAWSDGFGGTCYRG